LDPEEICQVLKRDPQNSANWPCRRSNSEERLCRETEEMRYQVPC